MAWSVKQMGDTRREREGKARRTFGPLKAIADEIRNDAVSAIKGQPVIKAWGNWMDAGDTLMSFGGCFERIAPDADLRIFQTIGKRLKAGVPITQEESELLIEKLREVELIYRATPLKNLKAAILTEQIAIEMESLAA